MSKVQVQDGVYWLVILSRNPEADQQAPFFYLYGEEVRDMGDIDTRKDCKDGSSSTEQEFGEDVRFYESQLFIINQQNSPKNDNASQNVP